MLIQFDDGVNIQNDEELQTFLQNSDPKRPYIIRGPSDSCSTKFLSERRVNVLQRFVIADRFNYICSDDSPQFQIHLQNNDRWEITQPGAFTSLFSFFSSKLALRSRRS